MSVWLFVCPGTDIDPKLVEYTLSLTFTTHLTHLYSTNPCLILLQCYNASYFLWFLNKNSISRSLVSPITTFYETRDPTAANLWNVTRSRHFRLPRLQLPKSSNSRASKMWKMSVLRHIMPKIPKIKWKGSFRFLPHFGRTGEVCRSIFDKSVHHCPYFSSFI